MTHRTTILSLAIGALVLGLTSPAFAATACYMKIGDVKGESQDSRHKDWIEVESYSPRPIPSPQGRPRGKAAPGQITVLKRIDKASPKLAQYASRGKHFPTAVLECRKAGGEKEIYLRYRMKDIRVSSIEPRGNMEEVSFTYRKLAVNYLPAGKEKERGEDWKPAKAKD